MPSLAPESVTAIHKDLLIRWRNAMNLVGPGPVEGHFEDTERAVRCLEPQGCWADLGSGAGFPGIALAAWHPHLEVHLVESRERRVAFLRTVLRETGLLNAQVRAMRVEDLPAAAWDGVIARAFAPPPVFMQHACRLLKPGGLAVLMAARELPTAAAGLVFTGRHDYQVGSAPRVLGFYHREP